MATPLISPSDLHRLLDSGGPVTVLDVRYRLGGPPGPAEHAAGHVPGAVYVDLGQALAAEPHTGDGGRHPLPDPEVFGAAMRAAGVSHGTPVVVYDDWSGHAAARCWWLLRHHGHDDVRVLDGAWPAWLEAGGSVETDPAPVAEGDFVPGPGRMPVTATAEVADGRGGVLVDARAPERFRGEVEPVDPVAGHVPGAVNVPTSTNLGADGRFRPGSVLAALYEAAGVEATGPVTVYCGSGVTACHDVLALEVAGVRAALWPGSWSAWTEDPDRPVATGT